MANRGYYITNKFRKIVSGTRCIYCGEAATTIEHFPPASATHHGLLLPACLECNIMASANYPYDMVSRAEFVNMKLRLSYKKFLNSPDWSKEELNEVSYTLEKSIAAWQKIRDIAKERIAWNAVAYIKSIDHNNYFAQLNAKIDFIIKYERKNYENIENIWSELERTSDWY